MQLRFFRSLLCGIAFVLGCSFLFCGKPKRFRLGWNPADLYRARSAWGLPEEISTNLVIVLDPMLATGGSGIAAIDFLKAQGAKSIKFMCLIASEKGIAAIQKAHPDVDIFAAAYDEKMNDKMYIVPGLGDAGDRLFGTK